MHRLLPEVVARIGRAYGEGTRCLLIVPEQYTLQAEAEIVEALQGLDSLRYGQAVRAKGYVASEGEDWIYFDYVPGERELRRGAPAVTGRLCVIGSGLDEEGLRELFKLG